MARKRCRICSRWYAGYYVEGGVCEECRVYLVERGLFRWSRRVCDEVMGRILDGDYGWVLGDECRGLLGEVWGVVVGLVLRFFDEQGFVGGRRYFVGDVERLSQGCSRYDIGDMVNSKVLRDLVEGADSGRREFWRLRSSLLARRSRERICEGSNFVVEREGKREVISEWFDSLQRRCCVGIERSRGIGRRRK